MKNVFKVLFFLTLFSVSAQTKPIPGLVPTDVYLNMEKQGFKTAKQIGNEYGNNWTSTLSASGIEYIVSTYSNKTTTVLSVKATAILHDVSKQIVSTKQFFKYIGSLPFTGNNPTKIANWLDSNFNIKGSTIVVSGVVFTLLCPSNYSRILTIEAK